MNWFKKRKQLNIQEFAHTHRNYLVIICDPKDDTMFASYKDQQVSGKIQSMDGRNHEVVKRVLKHSTFESSIDNFIGALIDRLKTPLKSASDFYKFLDGALFNITKSLQKRSDEEKDFMNRLMKEIADGQNVELYQRNIGRFTSNERRFLESKLTVGATTGDK